MSRVVYDVWMDGAVKRPPETTKVIRVDDLRVPIPLAVGRYEGLTDEQLAETIEDLEHERTRRSS